MPSVHEAGKAKPSRGGLLMVGGTLRKPESSGLATL